MASSGMPVYAEQASKPEISETDKKLVPETGTASVLGIKKLYAEEPSTLTTGMDFNVAIKTLAAGTAKSHNNWDSLIQSVQVVNTRPSDSTPTKDVSANKDGSYLAWWDAETSTIKLYSNSGDVILNPDSSNMFGGCEGLTILDVSNWNTSQVTDMSAMFYGCSSLITLDVSNWETSHVTDMSNMFNSCWDLNPLNVSNWDTSQVANMSNMFYSCSSLTTLEFSNWDTSKVTSMRYMFNDCSELATLDVSNWKTSQVTDMSGMFAACSSLTTLNVSKWDTSHVTDMSIMFSRCSSLATLDVSKWNTSRVTGMGDMFYNCSSLTTIYIGDGWNTDKVTISDTMFYNCTNLPNFDASVVDKTHANALPDGYLLTKTLKLRYLANSSYVLSGTSDYGTPINMVVTSNKNGRMSLKNIEKGTYTLTEVSPTDGYIKNSVKYTVTVTDSGVSVTPDNADYYYETTDQKVLFNEPYHAFTIQKASSTDSTIGVAGAEFLLSGVSDYGTEVSQTQTTGSTGIATFDHLEAGNYLLTETKAPEHYALDPISRVVSINKYGTVKIDGLPKEGSSFVWTDIRNADGTVTITKKWNDTLTGTNAAGRTLPSIVISTQRTIPDAVTITYDAGDGYFGTDQNNKTNRVTYSEVVDQNGNILSVSVSKGQEMTPTLSGKTFDAWYLDTALTNKAPDSIADYIKENTTEQMITLYAKYAPTLTTGKKFNEAIKTLAAGGYRPYNATEDLPLIQSVQVVDTRPSDSVTTKDVSANNDGSYLVWWNAETHTIKLYSDSGAVILNPDSSYMFYGFRELTTLDVSKWDTSQVMNMKNMFYFCNSLTALDVSNWDTSRVTNMFGVFGDCSSLATLDVSGWDTSKVTDMSRMFYMCQKLISLDVSNWDTSNVTNMRWMFRECVNLTTLNVSGWDTSKVTDMSSMFEFCGFLTSLGVSKWDTSNVTSMYDMFNGCSSLTTLEVSKWHTSKVTNMSDMFSNCEKLTTLDLSGWDTRQVTDMSEMFYDCGSLTAIYIGEGWNTDKVTASFNMFEYCTKLPNFTFIVDKRQANAGPGGYMTLK